MTESYWNISIDVVRTPLDVLREQASLLSKATRGMLTGKVTSSQDSRRSSIINIRLAIVVPAMNDYEYTMIIYEQPIEMFPGKFFDVKGDEPMLTINSISEFEDAVKTVLMRDKTGRAISSLISQVQAISQP